MSHINSRALADWITGQLASYGPREFIREMERRTGVVVSQSSLESWSTGTCNRLSKKNRDAIRKFREMSEEEFIEWLRPDRQSPVEEAIALISKGFEILKDCAKAEYQFDKTPPDIRYFDSDGKKSNQRNMAQIGVAVLIDELLKKGRVDLNSLIKKSKIPPERLCAILEQKVNPTDQELVGLVAGLQNPVIKIDYDFLKRLNAMSEEEDRLCTCEGDRLTDDVT